MIAVFAVFRGVVDAGHVLVGGVEYGLFRFDGGVLGGWQRFCLEVDFVALGDVGLKVLEIKNLIMILF
jgi:hypothetical protein